MKITRIAKRERTKSRHKRLLSMTLAALMVVSTGAMLGTALVAPAKAAEEPKAAEEGTSTVDFDENIMLSIFWPPTPDYINDEQYQLMADAGINWVLGAGEETLATPANQKKMLELCEKYGIHLIVHDGEFGSNLLNKSESYVAKRVNKYTKYSSLGGFYILDEPYNANNYVEAYLNLKKTFPDGYMHLNFLPSGSYGSTELYQAQMNDWCRLCAAGGYPVDYLIYDRYPFGLTAGSMDRNGFYTNLRAVHDVGLKNGVRTGTYIQTVKQSVAFRRPTDSEIRYEMYSALAFGFKQLSFFTWFTPVNRSEPFEDGIIGADGVPNEHYETIKTINHEILAIGSTLVKCEALEVYLNGRDTYGQPSIPSDFFVQPDSKSQSYTVSFLKHQETGRNYLMVVNNNFSKASDVDLILDARITGLSEVSRTDGSLQPVALDGNKLHIELAAGDAIFLALPEGLDFEQTAEGQPAADVNLAADALITATQSPGEGGYYMAYLNDGRRFADGTALGWRSTSADDVSITLDLGRSLDFNRIDLYPEGTLFTYGEDFPEAIGISVSEDGETYTQVAALSDIGERSTALSVALSATQHARYIRLDLSGCRGDYVSLCEIEVYNDDGSLPAAEAQDPFAVDTPYVFTEGEDLALNKTVYPSSTTPEAGYRGWGWAADFINNGVKGQGWTSNVKLHNSPDATEYIIIDLGDVFAVDRVDVTTMGVFPEDFRIEMSTDGKTWTPIVSETGASAQTDGTELSYSPADGQPVVGRFLRFIATKLRGTAADGYMLQLGNISAYGTPVCDTTVLTEAMQTYADAGFDISVAAYTACREALEQKYLTQSQADAYAKALLELLPKEEETEPATEPATEPTTAPATEPVTEPATTPATELVTEPVTTPATATEGSAASTGGDSNDSGCSSALGGGTVALVAGAMASAVALKKKKKEE